MFSFIHILHFLLIFQPLIYALQLFTYENTNSRANRTLAFLMVFVSLFYFVTAPFFLEPLGIEVINNYTVYGLLLTINPFYYLYTRSLTVEGFAFDKKQALHFLPAAVFLILNVIAASVQEGLMTVHSIRIASTTLYNLQVIVYAILMLVLLRKHSTNLKYYFSFTEDINLNWMKVFVGMYIIISSLDLLVFYIGNSGGVQIFYYAMMVFFFNFLGYFGLRQKDIYDSKHAQTEISTEVVEDVAPAEVQEVKSGMPEAKKELLMESILKLMEKEKPYMDPKLTIFEFSKALDINKTYISKVINDQMNENFSSFINRYRIEEAKKYLKAAEYENYTIEGIAHTVGFNSKASFNNAFKKFTGMTPSAFKQQDDSQSGS
ncbi:MAG TPA: helix-turn-helix domain-containing protein [Bacteroidales bacterium]|nr:helix-turn-helix domain-containing protein [Bacteroidales bacterium]